MRMAWNQDCSITAASISTRESATRANDAERWASFIRRPVGVAMQRKLRQSFLTVLALVISLTAGICGATLAVDDPDRADNPDFYRKLHAMLESLERSDDPYIRQLRAEVLAAPGAVRFRRMTDDRSTWSNDGDPDRGHTEPSDGRPKSKGRTAPTNATIFIPQSALEPGGSRWRSGLLVHELVHALDLATGRYNRDYTVRERRATFMQNVWRHRVGAALRVSYHGKFSTLDYQDASRHGTIAKYVNYIFTRADFPKTPKD